MRRLVLTGIAVALFAAAVLGISSQLLTEYWWFQQIGYLSVFTARLGWQVEIAATAFFVAALFLAFNLRRTKPVLGRAFARIPGLNRIQAIHLDVVIWIVSVLYGILFASGAAAYWFEIGQLFKQVPFLTVDPVFQRDIAFYVFTLPAINIVLNWLSGLFLTTALLLGLIYAITAAFSWTRSSKVHLGVLLTLVVAVQAAARWLAGYELLFSRTGAVYGAGFTDVNVRLCAFRLMAVMGLFVIGGIWMLVMKGRSRPLISALAAWLIAAVVVGGVLPFLVQNWIVSPNEYEREKPYLEHHLTMTRQAFGIEDFIESDYAYRDVVDAQALEEGRITLENIRLWDPRPILPTYRQLQEMRPYYSFYDADVDRYVVEGDYRQVLLSVREMDIERIQNRTWINQHLQYTHGYGLVMSPVNEVTRQRLPKLWVSDIPPQSDVGLTVEEPRIYFGERTNQYVIVNTEIDEFDYPVGDGSAFYRYTGKDGVELKSLFHRIVFALRLGESRILLSRDINSDSRILYYRNILERAQKLAPFLKFDNDPYPVLADGRIFWMVDAYTTSYRYPYALPVAGWGNYVRNSVKVVVDAYHGTIDFYQVEPDPLLETYGRMFPGLIKPVSEMPHTIAAHMRYPEDLLLIQSRIYGTYHMTNTRAFYNREDAWELPREIYAGREQLVSPYYVVMHLPGSEQEEFVLMVPFSPVGRSNMAAWLAARSDGEHYGEVMVFKFPKDSVTLGPAQIEARIDQDPEISQLLTLWNQGGSQVIRGNLLVLPLGSSILYVEPFYLQSEQTSMPQLQRVIVADQSGLVMAQDFTAALQQLLGMSVSREAPMRDEAVTDTEDMTDTELAAQARSVYQKAQNALSNLDFVSFGEAWDELARILDKLNRE